MEDEVTSVTAFYADRRQDKFFLRVHYLKQTVALLAKMGMVVVVDDGAGLPITFPESQVNLITSSVNRGKFGAILAALENLPPSTKYVVQTDFDHDQNPEEAASLIRYLIENVEDPEEPALVIGQRYSDIDHSSLPEHRQALILFQKSFCCSLGYDMYDPVSGLRAYTIGYVKNFLQMARANEYGFGIDVGQLIVARLINAKVLAVPLVYTKPRDIYTKAVKFEDLNNALLAFSSELIDIGLGQIAEFFDKFKGRLESRSTFILDLTPLGTDAKILFKLKDNKFYLKLI